MKLITTHMFTKRHPAMNAIRRALTAINGIKPDDSTDNISWSIRVATKAAIRAKGATRLKATPLAFRELSDAISHLEDAGTTPTYDQCKVLLGWAAGSLEDAREFLISGN